ncbi:LacI family DNA-binding transcriptional regulator [Curtobacterium sp. Csp1]|uniref:LacI family DNA-binding transcriptional regulator n=1 Tax=unclassified Curtobacterium TaxID=257496 RepID=UPI0015973114|nr:MULTISPECIES: LacI family DNA-binding transcriptional regulator [unclassified Curtobacterium]QKS13573.1 LacI family DNA-binding transcriptional regulator [Curtobacterium sp. csp3]QKS20614.1 LacI family DNA-binding transcriptional regulator [Curtobacterium sp. Csp1]
MSHDPSGHPAHLGRPGHSGHPGRPARIADVAALAGVSIGTASKALNDTGQLRAETRERVKAAAEQLGFVGDARARSLSSGRSYTVGMVTTDSFGRFTMPVLLGAEDALSAGEVMVLVADTRDDHVREAHYLRSLVSRGVDGIIVTGRSADARPPIEVPVPVPVVYALTPSTSDADVSVTLDDAAGAAAAATHVLGLGRRRVAVVTGPVTARSAELRAAGARSVLGDRMTGEPLFGDWSERWGRRAVDQLDRTHGRVDAVVCGNDQIARGVCDRLRETGRSVPADAAVTGYDDWDVVALASRPPLTTVDMRLDELGRIAGRSLLELVAGGRPASTAVTPTLVVRESTAGA